MTANYTISDGTDLDSLYVSDSWIIDKFVGNHLFGWGTNQSWETGTLIALTRVSTPALVGSSNLWRQVSAGSHFSGAGQTDGSLWMWGENTYGQLGNGSTANYSSPIQIGTSTTTWFRVACGGSHTVTLRNNSTLWAWGRNNKGQLGNSTTFSYSSPIQIGALTTWSYVASGLLHSAAVENDGSLWTWGDNSTGQLGNGTTVDYSSPIQIGSSGKWTRVACGNSHTLMVGTDNSLWAVGSNAYGQLGNGNSINYSSPVQIGTLTDWNNVYCGNDHSLVISEGGDLYVWGRNNFGQLGDSTSTNRSSPTQVGSSFGWKNVSGGYNTTYGIQKDSTLWGWGQDWSTQLGNAVTSTTLNYSSPIQIGSSTNWKQVSGGNFHVQGIYFTDV